MDIRDRNAQEIVDGLKAGDPDICEEIKRMVVYSDGHVGIYLHPTGTATYGGSEECGLSYFLAGDGQYVCWIHICGRTRDGHNWTANPRNFRVAKTHEELFRIAKREKKRQE